VAGRAVCRKARTNDVMREAIPTAMLTTLL